MCRLLYCHGFLPVDNGPVGRRRYRSHYKFIIIIELLTANVGTVSNIGTIAVLLGSGAAELGKSLSTDVQ
jgi:hypothetical protein